MTLRTLVVGCGSIGSRHIRNLCTISDADVVAHDLDPDRVEQISDTHGIQTTTDFDAAMDSDTDCVIVCTPPDTHLDIANAALDVGAHVFIEKPLSDTLAGTDEFVRRAEQTDQIVYVACNMRFHPPVVQIENWLADHKIGELQFVRLRYGNDLRNWRETDYQDSYSADSEAGGGILRDGVHELDLVLKWLEDIEVVNCTAGTVGTLDLDVEDTAEILFESDTQMAEVHLDYVRPERIRTYELVGSEGIIRWVGRGKDPERSSVRLFQRDTNDWQSETFELTANEQYIAEMEDFLTAVREGTPPEMDARRGQTVLQLAELAEQSSQRGIHMHLGTNEGS